MALPTLTNADKILKYGGVGSLIAVMLVFWLTRSVTASQDKTLTLLQEHTQRTELALQKQLQLLRLICVNLGDNDAERAACAVVEVSQ